MLRHSHRVWVVALVVVGVAALLAVKIPAQNGTSSTGVPPVSSAPVLSDVSSSATMPHGRDGHATRHGDVEVFDLGGGVKLEMVYIQGGSFQMGSPESESGRDDDEGPVHTVDLDGFLMGKFEVTQEQYQAIMGTNPSNFKGATNPVEQVSWEDAQDFCRKISSKTGRTFRLPTEAEWEFACRAGSRTRFCFGDSDGGLGDYAWYDGNSGSTTHPVGGKKPNDWGLYDMHGNVWEWCSDWFGSYSSGTQRNPTGASSGSDRVFRGGSWNYSARDCRSAYRGRSEPGDRDNILGLRLSCPAVR